MYVQANLMQVHICCVAYVDRVDIGRITEDIERDLAEAV